MLRIGTAAGSGPWITTPWIAGAVNSATNGLYNNTLQGNAVLSATNGLYSNILQGNAVLSASNPIFTTGSIAGAAISATNGGYVNLLQGNAVLSTGNPLFVNPGTAANWGVVAQGSTTSGQVGPLVQAAVVTGTSSYTNAQTSPLNLDGSGNLKVNLQSGSIGSIGSFNQNFTTAPVVPTIQNSAYASGNGVGGFQTVSVFRAASNFSGQLSFFQVTWSGTEIVALQVFIFDKAIGSSTCGDKAAVSLLAADLQNLAVPPFQITAAAPTGTTLTQASVSLTGAIYNHDSVRGQNVYVCIVSTGTFTPAVGDLAFKIGLIQD